MGIVARTVDAFDGARDEARAAPMAAYMKHHFAFLGIAAPLRRTLFRQAVTTLDTPVSSAELIATVDQFWSLPEREYQYAGMEWLDRHSRLLTADHLPDLARFITTKSWWDTVDDLCQHPVGDIVRRSGLAGRAVMDAWLTDDNMWLQRSAILHMGRWHGDMDRQWLFSACLRHGAQKEFFIRKAIGWALRSHAHQGPAEADAVRVFIAENTDVLSGLSKREALKRIRH